MEERKQIKTECSACGADIIFLWTTKDKKIPVNPSNVLPDEVMYNYKKHVTHFITCPRAEVFRKRAQPDPEAEKQKAEKEFFESVARFEEQLKNDKRPFIIHNKHEITMPRYALLNQCANKGMGYDDLVNMDNKGQFHWLGEHADVPEEEEECLF